MFFTRDSRGKRKSRKLKKTLALFLLLTVLLLYTYRQDECVNYPTNSASLGKGVRTAIKVKPTEKAKQEKPITGRVPVVVITHARSGSSFFSEVLQRSTSVFYVFEPFHNIKLSIKRQRKMKYVNGTSRYFGPKDFSKLATDILKNMLTCNVDNVPLNVWESSFVTKSRTTMRLYACMKATPTSCPSILKTPCLQSSHILVKTTRIPMSVVEPLMDEIPSLKIIHLTRDPRAIIRSWMKFDWIKMDNLEESSTRICNEMYDNAATYKRLQRYHKRTFHAIYENIAYQPQTEFLKVFAFLKMEFTTTTKDFITDITFKSKRRNCGNFCPRRSNSTKEAERWRDEVKLDVVKIIDSSCGQLYRKVGYNKIFDEKMLRDHNYKLRYTPNVSDFDYG